MSYLVLDLAIVVVTVISSEEAGRQEYHEDGLDTSRTLYLENDSLKLPLAHVVFGLSLVASLVLTFQSYLNPTQRAEQLRSSAASLESITWLYRTKVGPFERGSNPFSKAPEQALLEALKVWNSELIAGTDLEHTDLKKKFPAKIFKHFQNECAKDHPSRKKADLQLAKIKALELQLRLQCRMAGNIDGDHTDGYLSFLQQHQLIHIFEEGKRFMIRGEARTRHVSFGSHEASVLTRASNLEHFNNAAKRFSFVEMAMDGFERRKLALESSARGGDYRSSQVDESNSSDAPQTNDQMQAMQEEETREARGVDRTYIQNKAHRQGMQYKPTNEEIGSSDDQENKDFQKNARKNKQDMQDRLANEQIKLESFDDHQSPVAWDAYLQLRVLPAIENYNQRIPYCLFYKNMWQVILFLCTAAGAALSYSRLTPYVAIVSATAAAVTAWIAFDQRSTRLVRYTRTVRQLEQLLAWWSAQGDADRSAKVNKFVTTAELIITSERHAWQNLDQDTQESNRDQQSTEKKRGEARRPGAQTRRSETGPVDIETGQ